MSARPVAFAPTLFLRTLVATAGAAAMSPAMAQPAGSVAAVAVDVRAQPLRAAVALVAAQARTTITLAEGVDASRQVPAVEGRLTVVEALAALLADSGYEAVQLPDGRWEIRAGRATTLAPVLVTGRGEAGVYPGGLAARSGRAGILGERDTLDTPFAVTSITAQSIEDQQARNISQVIAGDPSVRNLTSSNSWNNDYLIRGFRVTSDSVLFDGVPGLIPAYGNGTVNGIERVEIFKGPNSLLNGAGGNGLAVGGAVNLVPKRATVDPVTSVTLNYASDARLGTQVDLGRRFGVDGAFGVRVNVEAMKGRTAIDDFREKRTATALSLDYRGPSWRVFVDAGTQRQRYDGSEPSGYRDPGTPIPDPPGGGRNFLQPWTFSDTRGNFLHLRGEVDLAENVTAAATVARGTSDYRQAFAYAYFQPAGDGTFDEYFQVGNGHNETLTRKAELKAKFETGPVAHDLTLSAQTVRYTYAFTYGFDPASGGIDPVLGSNIYAPIRIDQPPLTFFEPEPKGKQTAPTVALVDAASFDGGRWQVIGGLRQQRLTDTRQPYADGALTPAIAVLHKPWQNVSVYANYIQALTTGPTAPDSGVRNPSEQFAPSKTRQYEVGGKMDFGRVGVSAAVYDITQPSGIVVDDGGTLPVFVGNGQQRNRGVELNMFGSPLKTLRLSGGIAVVDARFTRTQAGTLDGARVPGVPHTTVALNAQWDVPFAAGVALTATGQWNSRVAVDSGADGQVPSRYALDLGAKYAVAIAGRATTFRATVANVTGQERWIGDAYGGIAKPAPRTLLLSSTVDF